MVKSRLIREFGGLALRPTGPIVSAAQRSCAGDRDIAFPFPDLPKACRNGGARQSESRLSNQNTNIESLAMSKLCVTIHRFATDRIYGDRRDGAAFAYEEQFDLLVKIGNPHIRPDEHDFYRLCMDERYAHAVLSNCDCVVGNVGPFAYVYFYLRDKFQLDFRIIRDVRTAMWVPYLLQEALVSPYLRAHDTVIHSSAYSRELFCQLFPRTPPSSAKICYPLMSQFPVRSPRTALRRIRDRIVIGFVGRLTEDKGFHQAVELISTLEDESPGKYKLLAVGEIRDIAFVESELERNLGEVRPDADVYEWVPPVRKEQIWDQYDRMNVLFFPSTSNLETFGRILVEASYAGLPIIASDHGAAPELVDQNQLLATEYKVNNELDSHDELALGHVDTLAAAEMFLAGDHSRSEQFREYFDHNELWFSILLDGNGAQESPRESANVQRGFIGSLQVRGLEPQMHIATARSRCRRLMDLIKTVLMNGDKTSNLATSGVRGDSDGARQGSDHHQRGQSSPRNILRLGSIDRQGAELIGYQPVFCICDQASASAISGYRWRCGEVD